MAVIVALHVLGFGLLFGAGAGGVIGVGVGLTAYTLGMRHAFDADHIAAIDNVTRKLMADGQQPVSVGFFFSLGHSTIVFVMTAAFAAGLKGATSDSGVLGPTVSGTFLLLIGLLNLVMLVGIARVFRRMRSGEYDERQVAEQLTAGGVMNRLLGRVTRAIRKPWQMYPLGLLFGLGFDTATEVALLATAGSAAASGMPLYAILCLPVLFAAGMSLLDTLDGAFMRIAYGWAFTRPLRKVFYNLIVTALSVVVALGIGAIELFEVLTERTVVDLNAIGYAVVALFVLTWAVALAVWRFGRVEEKWAASQPSS